MKKLLYIIPMLFLMASCAKEPASDVGTVTLDVTVRTKAASVVSKAGDEATVNSVRVLAFHKATGVAEGSELCVLNEFYPFGFTVEADDQGNTLVNVTSTMLLGIHDPKTFEVFVILNEENYTLEGGVNLHNSLDAIAADASTMSDLTALLNKRATYTSGVTTEPAFLMSASKEVTMDNADRVVKVSFNTDTNSALKRSMAVITVDRIYSKPDSVLSKFFVLDAAIVNVPKGMAWGSADGELASATDTVVLHLGEATEIDGTTKYYKREWEGSVYKQVDVAVTRKEEADVMYYKTNGDYTKDNSGDLINDKNNDYTNGWAAVAPGGSVTPYTLNNPNPKKDDDKRKVFKSALAHIQVIGKKYGDKDDKHNSVAGLISKLETAFTAVDREDMRTYNIVTDYAETDTTYYEYCSEDSWTVNLGDTYYVPENISSDKSTATCIRVKLAVAKPTIDLTGVDADKLPSPGEATGSGITKYYMDNTYYDDEPDKSKNWVLKTESFSLDLNDKDAKIHITNIDGKGNIKDPTPKDFSIPLLFSIHGHVVNADDEAYEYQIPAEEKNYPLDNNFHVYVDGFYRMTTGLTATTTVNQNSGTFKWNIPAVDDPSTTTKYEVKEFLVPVYSKDGDYSVRRNTKYNVTLHLGDNTKAAMKPTTASTSGTKASSAEDFGIYATVTTEKINDYED